jgi:hypothetical protein
MGGNLKHRRTTLLLTRCFWGEGELLLVHYRTIAELRAAITCANKISMIGTRHPWWSQSRGEELQLTACVLVTTNNSHVQTTKPHTLI